MKKIAIIGSSAAAAAAIETIRKTDQESQILFMSNESLLPYNAEVLLDFVQGKAKLDKAYIKPKDFYADQRVECNFSRKITRINLKRKKIFTEDKEQIDFDSLIIADVPGYKFPDIKGINKTGLYDIYSLTSIKKMVDYLPVSESIVFEDDSLWGLKLALAFQSRGKEVYYVAAENGFLSGLLSDPQHQWLLDAITARGIHVLLNNAVAEVLGESDAKAVRLKSGKVLACEIIGFGKVTPDFKILNDSGLEMKGKICVNENYLTNMEGVYALGNACQRHLDYVPYVSLLETQGKIAATHLLGMAETFSLPLAEQTFVDENFTISQVGMWSPDNSFLQVREASRQEPKSSIKLWLNAGNPVTAVFVNLEEKKSAIAEIVQQKIPMEEGLQGLWEGAPAEEGAVEAQNSENITQDIGQSQG